MSDQVTDQPNPQTTPQSESLEKLRAWRLDWMPETIQWQDGWRADSFDARMERERLKEENRRRDRLHFSPELAPVTTEMRTTETVSSRLQYSGDLPVFTSERDIADWLGISLGRLRWFTHDKQVDFAWHYVRYTVPKRSGGVRVILAPKTELKTIQRKIAAELLSKFHLSDYAHGFVTGRSIVTNAAPHVGKQFVLNIDLKDFFPTISYWRVRGLFLRQGYSFTVASVLAMLCTERDRYPVQRNGQTVYVALGKRTLVQGAPTSPALSNIVTRRLDRRLAGLAQTMSLTYTRYADDLTFSGDNLDAVLSALHLGSKIVTAEGFTVNPDKTHLYRRSGRQSVTGLIVNDKLSVSRDLRRQVRAILHKAATTGLAAQNRENRPEFRSYLMGLIGFIMEADRDQGEKLSAQLKQVRD